MAYTTHKVWTQLAETDWYTPSADSFTLTSARQLAGLAQLVKQGNSFAGKTILLGADISLANDDKTFNRGVRWFDGIGSTQAPFAGTFDGNGYRITEMTAESTGQRRCPVPCGGRRGAQKHPRLRHGEGQRQCGRDRGAGEEHAVPWLRE